MACGDERGTDPRPRFWVLFAVRPDVWASTSALGPHRGRGLGAEAVCICPDHYFPFSFFAGSTHFFKGLGTEDFLKSFHEFRAFRPI